MEVSTNLLPPIYGKYATVYFTVSELEQMCISKLHKVANHPAFKGDIVIMPDGHDGKGAVIGFTMPMNDKLVPNVIGRDINCAVVSFCIGRKLKMSLPDLDTGIREHVPVGTGCVRSTAAVNFRKADNFWNGVIDQARKFAQAYERKFGKSITSLMPDYGPDYLSKLCRKIGMDEGYAVLSIGSKGSGNHFAEVELSDMTGYYWVTIHTGSRNLGSNVCDYWQKMATLHLSEDKRKGASEEIREMKSNAVTVEQRKQIESNIRAIRGKHGLNDKVVNELAYLEGDLAVGYLYDMIFTSKYADLNRQVIMKEILGVVSTEATDVIESSHNYIDFEDFIIRKGAIKSYKGQKMLIPFNMQAGVIICEGRSNPEWNFSAPHGAGRLLPRGKCAELLNLDKFKASMEGIYTRSCGRSTIDEAPDAYKDPEMIKDAIKPTADIIDTLRPVLLIKELSV